MEKKIAKIIKYKIVVFLTFIKYIILKRDNTKKVH